MFSLIKRVWLGIFLICLASAVLLFSDLKSRTRSQAGVHRLSAGIPKIALVKIASNSLVDDVEAGVLDGLSRRGYVNGKNIAIARFSAENDLPTLNGIAKQVTDRTYDLVVSISTLALQAVAAANRDAKIPHVFAGVTDPVGAGVGIRKMNSLEKPAYMTGFGTFQPVEEIFVQAKELHAALKTVGVVWNPTESNSEACLEKARHISGELGVKLLEGSVHQSQEVVEAAQALIARGAEAFWVGCDSTVNTAIDALCATAAQAGIPVFSNVSGHVSHGSLFDLGANYLDVGRAAGEKAAEILGGADPSAIEVSDLMPSRVMLNERARAGLKEPWRFNDDIERRAESIIDANGVDHRNEQVTSPSPQIKKRKLELIYYNDSTLAEESIAGIEKGLAAAGLRSGVDFDLLKRCAQGDMATLASLVDAALQDRPDMLFILSTPALQATLQKVHDIPIVFTMVADPVVAGAGKSNADHLSNVTGVYTVGAYDEMAEALSKYFPTMKKVGTLFSPAETNSVYNKEKLETALRARGISLVAVPVSQSGELAEAASALCSRDIDAVVQIVDNQVSAGFGALAKAASTAKRPLFAFESRNAQQGAVLVFARDYVELGKDAASMGVQILRGANPASMPFAPPSAAKKIVNRKAAGTLGLSVPPALLRDAFDESGALISSPSPSKAAHISLIQLVEAPAITATREGIRAGLKEAGLNEGKEYELAVRDAQGDFATLGTLLDASISGGADLIYTITTPALQAAMQRVKDRPIIFALSLDPLLIGDSGSHEQHRANVAGVFDRSPFEKMVDIIREVLPRATTIGTLYSPAESNSVHFEDEFRKAAGAGDFHFVAVASHSPGEVAEAALALTQRGVDVICQINDNMHEAAFPSIVNAGRRAHIPVFAFSAGLAKEGAAVVLSNDHFEGGRESGLIAAKVLQGASPSTFPYRGIEKVRLIVNPSAAKEFGIEVPADTMRRADEVIDGAKGSQHGN